MIVLAAAPLAGLWLALVGGAQGASLSLTPLFNGGDGAYMTTNLGGQSAWKPVSGSYYLYFNVPLSFSFVTGSPIYVQVTYYDDVSGTVSVQYDSTNGAYASSEAHTRSSCVGSSQYVAACYQLAIPRFAGRQNGGADFRVCGYPPVQSVVVQDVPFTNMEFQLVLSKPWLQGYAGPTRDEVDASTLRDKVMVGYQGWFSTPNDLNDGGWGHWCRNGVMTPTNFTIDMWPDLTQYDPGTWVKAGDVPTRRGQPASLFSSSSPEVVRLHFQWMRKYNMDGAFLQRFLNPSWLGADGRSEWVLANVREAASREGRIWAIEYDISGLNDTNVWTTLTRDWKWLVDTFHLLQDPRYCRQGGRPVVVIWGLPFADRGISHDVANQVVDFFKTDPVYGSNYVVGGIPNGWSGQTTWYDHFQKYDGLLVWQPQNFNNDYTTFTGWGKDYYPHVWPGFSWANLRHQTGTTDYTARSGGTYYWNKIYGAIGCGANRLFVGMFDEYDEGTAIMPMTDDPPLASTNWGRFLTNDNRPSDWWMALTGEGKAMLLKQRSYSATLPTTNEVANRSDVGFEIWTDLGASDQSDRLARVEEADGHTVVETVGGRESRGNANTNSDLYVYFRVADSFLYQTSGGSDVTVEVEYYDETGSVRLGLQYDGLSSAYQAHSKSIRTAGTGLWRKVRFEIADAYFGNRQNSGADFRVTIGSGRAHLNRVWVRRPGGFTIANLPPPDVQATSATLAGTLTQETFADEWAAVWLYWGTRDGGTTKTNWDHEVFLGTNSHHGTPVFTATPDGLSPDTPHYYRFHAANSSAAIWADSTGLFATSRLPIPITFIGTGAVWRYFDRTNDLGTRWRSNTISDATWGSGPAMLGFGDANGLWPTTTVANRGQWTTYFRRGFFVPDPSLVVSLSARLLRDDGAVVYLNGAEVWRDNLPDGVITNHTPASASIGDADEGVWLSKALSPTNLVSGSNLLAVEIHQVNLTSTDLTFDFELTGTAIIPSPPTLQLTRIGNRVSVNWPPEASYFTLYSTTNLTVAPVWTLVTNLPTLSNHQWTVNLPVATNGVRFYRLRTQ